MKQLWTITLALLVLGHAPAALAADEDERSISVQGMATVSAAPDAARITAGVETAGDSADGALAANNAAMRRVMDALAQNGVDRADIRTSGFSISPHYDRPEPGRSEPPRITGYRVSNRVTVHVRDLDRLGALMDVLVREGANRMNGIEFLVSDETKAMEEARRKAVRDARRKAEVLASEAGVKLGRVLRISEAGGGGPPRPMMMMARAESAVPVAPGTLDFHATVSLTYAIADR